MYNMVGNFKLTLRIIGFSILTVYRKTEYFVGKPVDFEKNSKYKTIFFNAYLYHELTYDDSMRGLASLLSPFL